MDQTTIVLPSARAIRYEQLLLNRSTLFLPSYITINELVSKLCIVEEFKIADEDSRVLLLLEASNFKAFSKLQIERNFFTFTKNSSYILKFFEELSAELYDINELDTKDIYAEYEEHIRILQELYKRYEILCKSKKVLDKIFLPKLYKFNEAFAKRLQNIEIYIDGHLTNFELELLQKSCEFCNVYIIITTSRFNTKMQKKILETLDITLDVGFKYKISFNTHEIIAKEKTHTNAKISCESFSEPILQIAYVKKKIYDFIAQGYKSENIAVIVPDEKMATLLKSFDNKANLNFAMGEPFTKSKMYEKLNASAKAVEQDSKENHARVTRVSDEVYKELFSIYYKKSVAVDFLLFLTKYSDSFSNKKEKKIFDEEVFSFKNILPFMKDMSVKSLLHIFLQRLSSRTIDDVRGGKVTVMGVLETRSIEFDAVVIVDFSDANVPKKSDKDMFLNSQIRELAMLPTMGDRENLQKHYYEMLINRSKEIAISYVKASDSNGSRFLKQLNIQEHNRYSELEYANILFEKMNPRTPKEEKIVLEYSFKDKKLSSTKLKIFLTCKRKYYYKYIKHINNHEIPKDMPKEWEIGTDIHTALKELYTKKDSYFDIDALRKDLYYELDKACGSSELEKYLISLHKRRLDSFCHLEIERFSDGWKVQSCEQSSECEFAGMTLVGQIDRIDKKGQEIYVLDYKTGSYPTYTSKNFTDATDFQLEFYYLLAKKFGRVAGCGYYDLKDSKIVQEVLLQEKLEVLESHINELLNIQEVDFSLCEDINNCNYCEYSIICARG